MSDNPTTPQASILDLPELPDLPGLPTQGADGSPTPRIRWAAIVWGLILAVIAVTVLALVTDPERRAAVATFLWSLDGPTVLLLGLVALGFIMLVAGALTAVRRAQGRRTTSS